MSLARNRHALAGWLGWWNRKRKLVSVFPIFGRTCAS